MKITNPAIIALFLSVGIAFFALGHTFGHNQGYDEGYDQRDKEEAIRQTEKNMALDDIFKPNVCNWLTRFGEQHGCVYTLRETEEKCILKLEREDYECVPNEEKP